MPSIRRVYYTRPIPPDAQPATLKGKPAVRFAGDGGRTVVAALTRDGRRCRVPSAKWYGQYTDASGKVCRVPLSENKTAAQQMLTGLVRRAELEKAGIRDPFHDHRRRPLAAHRDDWEASLRANGRGDEYVKLKLARLNAILDGCRFTVTADLSADRLELFLAKLRDGDAGLSIQTCNDYLQAAKQFARWLIDNDRLDRNPFARLRGGNVKLDRRHDRRDLPPAELKTLLGTARASGRSFRGLTGGDRFHLYLCACGTGFRAAELAALTAGAFALDATPATATLAAEFTKNRKPAVQPLPPEVAAALRGYLAGRPADLPVWPGTWADRSADMLKGDLAAAGIPYAVDGPHGPLYADFHALRHSYITMLERAGVSPKTAQELARHSDIRLTMQRYTHKTLHDLGAAVEGFPSVLPADPSAERQAIRATGTDGREPRAGHGAPFLSHGLPRVGAMAGGNEGLPLTLSLALPCPDLALPGDSGRGPVRAVENDRGPGGDTPGPSQVLTVIAPDSGPGTIEAERAGFEPAVGFDPYAALAKRGKIAATLADPDTSARGGPSLALPLALVDDPGLARVVAAWPALPVPIRRAILSLIVPPE